MQTLSLSRSARWKMLEDRVPPVELGHVFNNGNNSAVGRVESRIRQIGLRLRTRKRLRSSNYPLPFFPLGFPSSSSTWSILFPCFINVRDVSMHVRTLIPNGYSRNAQSRGDSIFDFLPLLHEFFPLRKRRGLVKRSKRKINEEEVDGNRVCFLEMALWNEWGEGERTHV